MKLSLAPIASVALLGVLVGGSVGANCKVPPQPPAMVSLEQCAFDRAIAGEPLIQVIADCLDLARAAGGDESLVAQVLADSADPTVIRTEAYREAGGPAVAAVKRARGVRDAGGGS